MRNDILIEITLQMEYGIWSLHAANRLWGDPQLVCRPAIPPPYIPQILARAGFSLNSFYQHFDYKAYQVKALKRNVSQSINTGETMNKISTSLDTMKKSKNNEDSIERDKNEENKIRKSSVSENPNNNDNEEPANESDTRSTNSSYPSEIFNLSNKPLTPFSYFGLDKNEIMTPMLSGWVLGAYTAMLGTLSAATAPFEAAEVSTTQSDSESESGHSSYTEKSADNNSVAGIHEGYPCSLCNVSSVTRSALREHILHCHQASSENSDSHKNFSKVCLPTEYSFINNNKCQMKTDIATDMMQEASSGKKRTLALQRVRYEREEYRCTQCSYACTIEKAFHKHLRAHAKGAAPETRVSCAVCGADRSSEVDLSRHMRRHRDDRYFCCDICVFRTVQLKKLIQHRRMHTGEKPHLCPHCAYRSARRDNLRSHVRRVHKKENLYCDTFSPQGVLIATALEASSITRESIDAKVQRATSPFSSSCDTIE